MALERQWGHRMDAWGHRMDAKALLGNHRLEPMSLLAQLRQPDSAQTRTITIKTSPWAAERVACAYIVPACQVVKMLNNTIHNTIHYLHSASGATRRETVSEGRQQHWLCSLLRTLSDCQPLSQRITVKLAAACSGMPWRARQCALRTAGVAP